MNDNSGFIDDRQATGDMIYIPVGKSTTFCVGRTIRHGRWVVVKSINPDFDAELGRVVLEKEFNILSNLQHPSIVQVIDFCHIDSLGWSIVMEWIDGEPIDIGVKAKNKSRRRAIAEEIIDAVAYMHSRGITHRDIKPSNILLDRQGHPHIIDFGLADDHASALIKQVTGTRAYVAPEVVAGGQVDWPRADVYAVGLILKIINPGADYTILSKNCLHSDPLRRPADGRHIRLTRSRIRLLRNLLRGILIITILALTAWCLFCKSNRSTPLNAIVTPLDTISTLHDTISNAHPADLVVTESTSSQQSIILTKPEQEQEQEPAPSADINFALLRARALRDSIVYKNPDTELYRLTPSIDHLTDSLLNRGIRFGFTPDEVDFYKQVVRSDEFYNRGTVRFMN